MGKVEDKSCGAAEQNVDNGTAEKNTNYGAVEKNMSLVYSVDDAVNKIGYGRFQIQLTILAGLGWLADSCEIFILSVIGDFVACDWEMYRWQVALLTSVVFASIMVGSPILGTVADIYGRRKCLAASVVLLFIFGSISAASPSYLWMVIFRACVGFSLGGIGQGITLNSEYCPTDMRGRTGFYLCYFWSLGSISVVLLTWLVMIYVNNWRLLVALVAVPSLIVVISLKWYPESARYFLVSGQYEKSAKTLRLMSKMNGVDLPLGKLAPGPTDVKRGRMADLLQKEYRMTSIIFWYILFAVSVAYYGVALLSPLIIQNGGLPRGGDGANGTEQNFVESMQLRVPCASYTQTEYVDMLWTSAAEFPGILVFTFLIERISRKLLMSCACFVSGFLTILLLLRTHRTVILLLLFGSRAILCALFQLSYIMVSEAYPTTIRAIAVGTAVSFCRLGGLLVPFVAQVLVIENPVLAMCLLGVVILLAGIAALLLPQDTRGAILKESHQAKT